MSGKAHSNHRRPITSTFGRAPPARGATLSSSTTSTSSTSSCTSLTVDDTLSLSSHSESSRGGSAFSQHSGASDELDRAALVKACRVIICYNHPRYVEVQAVLNALKPTTSHASHLKDKDLRRLKRYALDALPYAKYPPSPVVGAKHAIGNKSTTPKSSPPWSNRSSVSSAGSRLKSGQAVSPVSSLDLDRRNERSPAISRAASPAHAAASRRLSACQGDSGADGVDKVLRALALTTPLPASRPGSGYSSPSAGMPTNRSTNSTLTEHVPPTASSSYSASRRSSETVFSESDSSSSGESTASLEPPQVEKMSSIVERFRRQARDVLIMCQTEVLG